MGFLIGDRCKRFSVKITETVECEVICPYVGDRVYFEHCFALRFVFAKEEICNRIPTAGHAGGIHFSLKNRFDPLMVT